MLSVSIFLRFGNNFSFFLVFLVIFDENVDSWVSTDFLNIIFANRFSNKKCYFRVISMSLLYIFSVKLIDIPTHAMRRTLSTYQNDRLIMLYHAMLPILDNKWLVELYFLVEHNKKWHRWWPSDSRIAHFWIGSRECMLRIYILTRVENVKNMQIG